MRTTIVPGVKTIVGESPVWDEARGVLWMIDILAPSILRVGAEGEVDEWRAPEQIGAVAPCADGRVAVALASGFCLFDPEHGRFGPVTPAGCAPGAVISEGGPDRTGRLVGVSGDSRFADPLGRVHRWEHDGSVTVFDEGFVLGNGLCWNRDGSVMYAADSLRGTIFAYDYTAEVPGRPVVFAQPTGPGFPDGATVDSEDHLWVVLHNGGVVIRLDPRGREVARHALPGPHVTSLAFRGTAPELFLTSLDHASIPGDAAPALDVGDAAGVLYRAEGVGCGGVAEAYVRPPTGA